MRAVLQVILPLILFISISLESKSQGLAPGFNASEYIELLKISAATAQDSSVKRHYPTPHNYQQVYRSSPMGLDNLWELWVNGRTAVISIRGTTPSPTSWLANFYAAMVPAQGELVLSESEKFVYHLADNPRAAVHVGWLLSMAFLSKEIIPKLDSCYQSGIKEYLIMGHSQGGAIAYLLTSYLFSLKKQEQLPDDMIFKTYCSAAPKPGNLYYAYEYEHLTAGGWAFNIVNSVDWVPETPISIQTIEDFNQVNPFVDALSLIEHQSFFKRIAMKRVYNKLVKPMRKAQKNYEKYLGEMTSRFVVKSIKEFQSPKYMPSNNYVRTGETIVLMADDTYSLKYPDSTENIFVHHDFLPYIYLAERQFLHTTP